MSAGLPWTASSSETICSSFSANCSAMVAKTLADELGPRAIRVNGLLPGRIGTERVEELDAATGDPSAARATAIGTIPLGRYGEPHEFAAAAGFLLSPASSFVTGAMLPVDGGMLRAL